MRVQWDSQSDIQQVEAVSAAVMIAVTTAINSTESAQFVNSFLHYEVNYKMLICKKHDYTLWSLSTHLCNQHFISAKTWKAIVEKYNSYTLLNSKDILLPPLFKQSFEALTVTVKAFLCDEKKWSVINKNCSVVVQHCNKAHEWNSIKKDQEHWTNIKVQTFFASSDFQCYFIVHVLKKQETWQANNSDCEEFVATTLKIWKKTDKKYEKSLKVTNAQIVKTDWTEWYNCTDWLKHIAKQNLMFLVHVRQLLNCDEKKLQQIVHIVNLLIEKCVTRLSTLTFKMRWWLKSTKHKEINVKLIKCLQNLKSQKQYVRYWK